MNIESQCVARELLITKNLTVIEADVAKARRQTEEEVAVLVLDLRDEHARVIAAFVMKPPALAARRDDAARRDVVPVAIWPMPRRLVIDLVRYAIPEFMDVPSWLDAHGGYLAVAVGHGGVAATVVRTGQAPDRRRFIQVVIA